MKLRSVIRRLAVTMPFFLTAAAILRVVASPLDAPTGASRPLVLIVTTERLHPAFRALELWNTTQGCRARVVTLDAAFAVGDPLSRLGSICREAGATGMLLGGDEAILPILGGVPSSRSHPGATPAPSTLTEPVPAPEPIPPGVRVGRARVRDLEEAWAFVESCRTAGRTLDELIAGPGPFHAGGDESGEITAAVLSAPPPVPH